MRRALFQVGWHLHRFAYRLLGPRVAGSGTLELRTVGRRSGHTRMTLLTFLPDGDRRIVVAWNPGYADYAQRAGERQVPVVVLEPLLADRTAERAA